MPKLWKGLRLYSILAFDARYSTKKWNHIWHRVILLLTERCRFWHRFNIYFFMHFWWEEFLYFQDLQFFLMKLSFSHCKSWFNLKNICIIKHIWKTKDLWVYRKLFTTPSFLFLGTKYLVHKLFLHSFMQKNYKNIYTFKINGKKWLFLP